MRSLAYLLMTLVAVTLLSLGGASARSVRRNDHLWSKTDMIKSLKGFHSDSDEQHHFTSLTSEAPIYDIDEYFVLFKEAVGNLRSGLEAYPTSYPEDANERIRREDAIARPVDRLVQLFEAASNGSLLSEQPSSHESVLALRSLHDANLALQDVLDLFEDRLDALDPTFRGELEPEFYRLKDSARFAGGFVVRYLSLGVPLWQSIERSIGAIWETLESEGQAAAEGQVELKRRGSPGEHRRAVKVLVSVEPA